MKLSTTSLFATGLLFACLAAVRVSYANTHSIEAPGAGDKKHGGPINVIFDTDMWSDIDDALALAMLHALQDRGEIKLLAVTISTRHLSSASFVDLVDNFYQHANIPIGIDREGTAVQEASELTYTFYTQLIADRRTANGAFVYPHRITRSAQVPDATAVLRKALVDSPDSSVVIVQVGFSTNLASLLGSAGDEIAPLTGVELVRRKVRLLSLMGGDFSNGKGSEACDFNLCGDIPASQKVFSLWPTPIVVSGGEIGERMPFPASRIQSDFAYAHEHPVVDAYKAFSAVMHGLIDGKRVDFELRWPYDRPTWDLTSVLYAVRPENDYFSLSKPGKITMMSDGKVWFTNDESGIHRYLILSSNQVNKTLEAMIMLASQPPRIK